MRLSLQFFKQRVSLDSFLNARRWPRFVFMRPNRFCRRRGRRLRCLVVNLTMQKVKLYKNRLLRNPCQRVRQPWLGNFHRQLRVIPGGYVYFRKTVNWLSKQLQHNFRLETSNWSLIFRVCSCHASNELLINQHK